MVDDRDRRQLNRYAVLKETTPEVEGPTRPSLPAAVSAPMRSHEDNPTTELVDADKLGKEQIHKKMQESGRFSPSELVWRERQLDNQALVDETVNQQRGAADAQTEEKRPPERADRNPARSESDSSKEKPAEREGAGQAEVSDRKTEKMAKMREQFEKSDFELAAREATRSQDRGGRE